MNEGSQSSNYKYLKTQQSMQSVACRETSSQRSSVYINEGERICCIIQMFHHHLLHMTRFHQPTHSPAQQISSTQTETETGRSQVSEEVILMTFHSKHVQYWAVIGQLVIMRQNLELWLVNLYGDIRCLSEPGSAVINLNDDTKLCLHILTPPWHWYSLILWYLQVQRSTFCLL